MPKRHKSILAPQQLQSYLGIKFQDEALLKRALTHRSCASEHMERLEFLGDAVLGMVMAEYLHDALPHEAEGKLSRLRASLVRKESLYEVAQFWHLQDYLYVGEGERHAQGVKSTSIVANAVEAVLGAVLKDAGFEAVKRLIIKAWKPLLADIKDVDGRDSKSRLQEYTQALGWGLPIYEVQDLGVDQKPRFEAYCKVQGKICGKGLGVRKKNAELDAAEEAWHSFNDKAEVES